MALAVSHKDTQRLCELLGASDGPGATDYDVDVSGNDIVVRCFRKIQYENGTMYEGFVDMSTGLADGQGCVTWSANAGRSSRKSYTGLFSAGLTAERVNFTWREHRHGQISTGNHSYNGTVEVMKRCCSSFTAIQFCSRHTMSKLTAETQNAGKNGRVDRQGLHTVRHIRGTH